MATHKRFPLCLVVWTTDTCVCACVCSHAGVSKCVRSSQHSLIFSPVSLYSFHVLIPPPRCPPLPFRCLSCPPEKQRHGPVALTSPLDPQETLTITAPPGCLTVQPVIPAQTKIASATHPHILCLLAVTYALTTVPVIVLYEDWL